MQDTDEGMGAFIVRDTTQTVHFPKPTFWVEKGAERRAEV